MREILGEGRFLRLVRVGTWEHAERTNAHGVVLLVAITDDRRLIFVEQFRPPVNARVLELPAGLAGDDVLGEPLENAAARELTEETGWQATSVTKLMSGPVSAGMTSESVTLFLATGLSKVGDGGGVEGENIVTHLVPVDDVAAFFAERTAAGVLIDLKTWGALWFAERAVRDLG